MSRPRSLRTLQPVAGLLVAAGLLSLLKPASRAPLPLAAAAAALFLLWLVHPASLARLHAGVQWLGQRLAAGIGLVAMAVVYFAVLTPVAWALRRGGRDLLAQRLDDAPGASQWQAPAPRRHDDDFFRTQF